jgi:hypothetical protein
MIAGIIRAGLRQTRIDVVSYWRLPWIQDYDSRFTACYKN